MWTCVLHLEMLNVASMQPRSFIDQINLSLRRNHKPCPAYDCVRAHESRRASILIMYNAREREKGRICRCIQRQATSSQTQPVEPPQRTCGACGASLNPSSAPNTCGPKAHAFRDFCRQPSSPSFSKSLLRMLSRETRPWELHFSNN